MGAKLSMTCRFERESQEKEALWQYLLSDFWSHFKKLLAMYAFFWTLNGCQKYNVIHIWFQEIVGNVPLEGIFEHFMGTEISMACAVLKENAMKKKPWERIRWVNFEAIFKIHGKYASRGLSFKHFKKPWDDKCWANFEVISRCRWQCTSRGQSFWTLHGYQNKHGLGFQFFRYEWTW